MQPIIISSVHNFIGRPIKGYQTGECILTQQAAIKLHQLQNELKQLSYSLKVYDCYRPTMAMDDWVSWVKQRNQQQMKEEFYPRINKTDFFKLGVIDKRSTHSRGSTVDLTLVPIPTPKQVLYHKNQKLISCLAPYNQRFQDNSIDMGTGYDCMDTLSRGDNKAVNSTAYHNRQFLKNLMKKYGFNSISEEWWHFTLENEPYPDQYFNFPIVAYKN